MGKVFGAVTALAFALAVTASAASAGPGARPHEAGVAVVQPGAARQAGSSDNGWDADATQYRGRDYQRFVYGCPASGGPQTVWGTDVYTDDSSVCTAAVHTGVITFASGGTVTIEIRPGLSSYESSARNGVTTLSYGAWPGSFVVVGGSTTVCGAPSVCTGGSGWGADAVSLRGRIGERFKYTCPAGGTARTVWGTGVYTDDSSVCTAAVHAGGITLARGGTVTIEIRAGESSYSGTTSNGITTRDYGAWAGSFIIVAASSGALGGSGWKADARHLRGLYGQRFTYSCPARGRARTVWGTRIYTDDSSVCTAAVHAGRFTLARGGTVTIEIRRGRTSYRGTTRNGITTRPYGVWPGSFVVI